MGPLLSLALLLAAAPDAGREEAALPAPLASRPGPAADAPLAPEAEVVARRLHLFDVRVQGLERRRPGTWHRGAVVAGWTLLGTGAAVAGLGALWYWVSTLNFGISLTGNGSGSRAGEPAALAVAIAGGTGAVVGLVTLLAGVAGRPAAEAEDRAIDAQVQQVLEERREFERQLRPADM